MYKYPSSGPTCISVITPNPCPNTAPPSLRSRILFAILSASGLSSTNPVLSSFSLKLYKLPKSTSPINIVFSYCFPNLSELRNLIAVGAIVSCVASSGALYTPFPPKVTKYLGGLLLSAPIAGPGLDPACHIPATCDQPLLNPGFTKLIYLQKYYHSLYPINYRLQDQNPFQKCYAYHMHSTEIMELYLYPKEDYLLFDHL